MLGRSLLLTLIVFFTSTPPLPQAEDPFFSQLEAVFDTYRAQLLEGNQQVTGTITVADGRSDPFTLTWTGGSSRLEVQKPEELVTVVRQGRRARTIRNDRRHLPDSRPLFTSSANFVPISVLRQLSANPLFTGSLVTSEEGSVGLQFVESYAGELGKVPFPQPLLIVTFWLDSANRITQMTYEDDRQRLGAMTYRYFYSRAFSEPFLQAGELEMSWNGRRLSQVQVSSVRSGVSVSPDAFALN